MPNKPSQTNEVRSVIGLDLGSANLRLFRTDFRNEKWSPPRPIVMEESYSEAVPTVLCSGEGTYKVSYGRSALFSDWTKDKVGHSLSGFGSALSNSSEDIESGHRVKADTFPCTQEEAFALVEQYLNIIGNDLYNQKSLVRSDVAGIVASIPCTWSTKTRERYRSILIRSMRLSRIEIVTDAEAAVAFHVAKESLRATKHWTTALFVNIGERLTQSVRIRYRKSIDKLEVVAEKTYTESFGGHEIDIALEHWLEEQLHSSQIHLDSTLLKRYVREIKEGFCTCLAVGEKQFERTLSQIRNTPEIKIFLTPERFEKDTITSQPLKRFSRIAARIAENLDFNQTPPDFLILTGASSLWYFVRREFERNFPTSNLCIGKEPQRAIGIGLALAPHILAAPTKFGWFGQTYYSAPEIYTLLRREMNEEAERAAKSLMQREPDNPLASAVYGYCLLRRGESSAGEAIVQRLIDSGSEPVELIEKQAISLAYTGRGRTFREAKEYLQAEESYRTALRYDYGNLLAHLGLGVTFELKQDYKQAGNHYQAALILDPESISALKYQSMNFLTLKMFANAEETLRKLLLLEPQQDVSLYHNLGFACERQKKYQEAMEAYAKAVEMDASEQRTREALDRVREIISGSSNQSELFDRGAGMVD